ncbi:hypothetical protein GGS20DRAFT_291763 [Poronia punctata]|nr:hypothetical protein GGS20DRAFT_291763 [Poronia punctata]
MMATEATFGGPVDVSSNEPSLSQANATGTDFQDADRPNIAVNGSGDEVENKIIAEIADELVNSAEASVSGGSDTEAFKTDPNKLSGDKGHARSSSAVKKPLSFKSVSVNRTFLASKGSANSTSRPESAAGSPSVAPQPNASSSASRLKLVAKSGSTLGGGPKSLAANGKTSGGNESTSVWNRNRVPTQPEAKKRSDEELKNAGIHMAERLRPEDMKSQTDWADIVEDENWAPDTITWTDGTKITLPQAEEIPASPAVRPISTAKVNKEPAPAPTPAPKPISSAPIATPHTTEGLSIKPGVLASGKGLVLKGVQEKPTLVAKPAAPPGPVKSPWAALPPVDRAPPAVMEVPNPMTLRLAPRDGPPANSVTPPPATKEIAADDFSRNYRDGSVPSSRELYNSQSGRYEPVSDRRGSRGDSHTRQPAVLQRQIYYDQGPAEPSAAFQTSRSSAQEDPYTRRRGSSNVSGGSGHLAPRLGGKPHDVPMPHEPGSIQGQGLPPHASPMSQNVKGSVPSQAYPLGNKLSNQGPHQPPMYHQALPSLPQVHAAPSHNASQPEPQQPQQADMDLEKSQKEFMKQKREEAIRRRQDEERAEEEAKKARIAEKLKALGPAPERKSVKKDASVVSPRTEIPPSLSARPKTIADGTTTSDQAPMAAPTSENTVERPIAGESEPEPKEFTEPNSRAQNGSAKRPVGYEHSRMAPAHQGTATHNQHPQTWTDTVHQPERFQTWTSAHQNASRNVWGAPGNDRSLGNGTFNADIGPLPDSHVATGVNTIHRPGPIGPPRPASQVPQAEAQLNRLAPIGPPRAQPNTASAWKAFDVKADDERRRLERIKQREALGDTATGPVVTDTWRPVELNEDGQRARVGPLITSRRDQATEHQDVDKTSSRPEVGKQISASPPTGPAAQIRTGSRFFPTTRDIYHQEAPSQVSARSKSPTPPPPTADGHPVYDGDATKPHVALPPQRPRVRLPPSPQTAAPGPIAPPVKQGPASFAVAAAAAAVSSTAPRATDTSASGRPGSRGRGFSGIPQKPHEIASQENWQSRINSLMGKKATSLIKPAPVPSMMAPIEFPRSQDVMDVPVLSPSGTELTEDSSFTSKEMAEECFGEQEMGSLPAVRLPTETPDAAWQAVLPNWHPAPAKLRVDPTGSEPFRFGFDYVHGKSVIRIFAPGMSDAKTVMAPVLNYRSGSNPRRPPVRGGDRTRHPPKGGRRVPRETLEHTSDHLSMSMSGRTASSRGPRNFRSRDTWSRQPSASAA